MEDKDMQAMILAAGMGRRLKHLTSQVTKCMVKVNGVALIERQLAILDKKQLDKIIIVVGYQGEKLKKYVSSLPIQTPIEFVENPNYDKTNNIYSLFLARKHLLQDDTLLLESDLIFEEKALDHLLLNPYPSLALVAKYESWMDGTVVILDQEDHILRFISKKEFMFEEVDSYYKTVNIYKFSRTFSESHYVPFLEAYIKALGNNEYYEQVLKVISLLDRPEIKAERLDNESWYEIDDEQDLNIAETIFADPEIKLEKLQKCYGGYWRYPKIMDFCYLVNPFFPDKKLVEHLKNNFSSLLCSYPSGMEVNSLLAAEYFDLQKQNVVVGNGAAELIKSLLSTITGRIGVIFPTFEEYPNRYRPQDIVAFTPRNPDFYYSEDDLIQFYSNKDISLLVLINPDNPSGNYISKSGLTRLIQWAAEKKIHLLIDESFVDFAEDSEPVSLLSQTILEDNPHLIVIKSISKSYGVPGLRLGVLACGDESLIRTIKQDVSIWNINSFAEYYLQIFEKYKADYIQAMKRFREVRREYIEQLKSIPGLRVIPSQANYVMCEVLHPCGARKLAKQLLTAHNILIKDLSAKRGVDHGEYIRIAVKTPEENNAIVSALRELLR